MKKRVSQGDPVGRDVELSWTDLLRQRMQKYTAAKRVQSKG